MFTIQYFRSGLWHTLDYLCVQSKFPTLFRLSIFFFLDKVINAMVTIQYFRSVLWRPLDYLFVQSKSQTPFRLSIHFCFDKVIDTMVTIQYFRSSLWHTLDYISFQSKSPVLFRHSTFVTIRLFRSSHWRHFYNPVFWNIFFDVHLTLLIFGFYLHLFPVCRITIEGYYASHLLFVSCM